MFNKVKPWGWNFVLMPQSLANVNKLISPVNNVWGKRVRVITYFNPEYFGATHPYSEMLPWQVLIHPCSLLQISWIPVIWCLELLCHVLHHGNATRSRDKVSTEYVIVTIQWTQWTDVTQLLNSATLPCPSLLFPLLPLACKQHPMTLKHYRAI